MRLQVLSAPGDLFAKHQRKQASWASLWRGETDQRIGVMDEKASNETTVLWGSEMSATKGGVGSTCWKQCFLGLVLTWRLPETAGKARKHTVWTSHQDGSHIGWKQHPILAKQPGPHKPVDRFPTCSESDTGGTVTFLWNLISLRSQGQVKQNSSGSSNRNTGNLRTSVTWDAL